MSESNEDVAFSERDIFRLIQTKSPGDELNLWHPEEKTVVLVRKGKRAMRVKDLDSEETYKLNFQDIAVKKS